MAADPATAPGSPILADRSDSPAPSTSSPSSIASSSGITPAGLESPRSVLQVKGPSFSKPRHLILHNDSTGCTQTPSAGAASLTPDDLARPRPNTWAEEAVAVVTMLLFFSFSQLLPVAAALAGIAAVFWRSAPAATFIALLLGATALPAGSRWQPFLHSRVWDCWRRRFRYMGVVPPVPYCESGEPHIFAHLPHAVFPMASFLSFPLCGDPGTGVPAPMEGLVATVLMRVPLYKHIFAWMGCVPADKPKLMTLLSAGTNVGVIVEGVAGIFHGATPKHERVYLRNRKGFVKAALQAGAPLVPVYHLGASQLLSFGGTASLSRRLRASVCVYWGTWGLPLPRRHDIISLVGRPIPVAKCADPSPAQVDALHARFCAELVALFDAHKHLLGWEHKTLEVV